MDCELLYFTSGIALGLLDQKGVISPGGGGGGLPYETDGDARRKF